MKIRLTCPHCPAVWKGEVSVKGAHRITEEFQKLHGDNCDDRQAMKKQKGQG